MNYYTILIYIIFEIFSIECFGGDVEMKRKLNTVINPGCPSPICDEGQNKELITVVHIQADSEYDTLHYLWDFTRKPTVLTALTPLNTSLNINWEKYRDAAGKCIEFSEEPEYVSSVIINSILQFDDVNDTGFLDNQKDVYHMDTDTFDWIDIHHEFNADLASVIVTAKSKYQMHHKVITLKFESFSTKDRGNGVPHLLHSTNSTEIDIIINNVTIEENMRSPRFAIELYLLTSEMKKSNETFSINQRKSLDDEHTPGIFSIVDILSPDSSRFKKGAFVQYRPVSYTSAIREVSLSTETQQYAPIYLDSKKQNDVKKSLVWSYYGEEVLGYPAQGVNISFGLTGDGFYTKTNYTTWTFIMGYGAPPIEEFSTFVIVVTSIGLGVPLFLLITGSLYICIKRVRN